MSVYLVTREGGESPIYRQIRNVLAKEIRCSYKAGELLPSENDLAGRFSVNRHTLRRAIDELVLEGLVERRHGRGVFVLEPAINYTIGRSTRFTETLHSQGKTTISKVLRKLLVPASEGVAKRLNLKEGIKVIFVETLREVEEKPFCIISHFLSYDLYPKVYEDYQLGSLHKFLTDHYALELRRVESVISAVLPEVDDASILNMPRQTPVLRVKSVNLDNCSNIPVEYAVTRFRGDATQLSINP